MGTWHISRLRINRMQSFELLVIDNDASPGLRENIVLRMDKYFNKIIIEGCRWGWLNEIAKNYLL